MSDLQDADDLLELEIPDEVPEADQAVELIRAWVADGALVVTLNGEAFGERLEEWGRLLAQIGHHVARSASMNGETGEQRLIAAVRKGFDEAFPKNELAVYSKARKRVTH
ncbi:MAG: DUF5076 domain-containing protein [Hyphomicrobium sp.]|nr:DUF5076 domain-containing protein [Hyphomicrobium sp.]